MAVETGALAQELRETIGRVVRRLRQEPAQLAVAQAIVLARLDREGPASTSDLAAAERMRPQSMAQTVRDLEGAGLVSRRPDPDDGRRMLLELTPVGLERLHAARAQREGWLSEVLERDLSAAERQALRDALVLLRRVADG
ncbi:MAG TPA: MarR family transcriptional regulator [Baekduia sp.]|nr:MarR family transcriptional regulator [Baekduia sp.]